MKIFRKIFCVSVLTVVLTFTEASIYSQQNLRISTETLPTPLNHPDRKNTDFEPSAVESLCNGQFLLIANDKPLPIGEAKAATLLIVDTKTGKVVNVLAIPKGISQPDFDYDNPKWEAMAKDDAGYFYVLGAHQIGEPKQHRFVRFRLTAECDAQNISINMKDKPIVFKIDKSLNDLMLNEIKIEGLAVKTNKQGTELFFGFRKHTYSAHAAQENKDKIHVYSSSAPTIPSNSKEAVELTLNPYFEFDAGFPKNPNAVYQNGSKVPFELSSLEYSTEMKGLLIITSTECDPANSCDKGPFFGSKVWYVSDKLINEAIQSKSHPKFKEIKALMMTEEFANSESSTMKAEGLSILPATEPLKLRFAIVYDNDQKYAGMVQFFQLSNCPK